MMDFVHCISDILNRIEKFLENGEIETIVKFECWSTTVHSSSFRLLKNNNEIVTLSYW